MDGGQCFVPLGITVLPRVSQCTGTAAHVGDKDMSSSAPPLCQATQVLLWLLLSTIFRSSGPSQANRVPDWKRHLLLASLMPNENG